MDNSLAKKSGCDDSRTIFPYLKAIGFQSRHGEGSEKRAGWHNRKFEQRVWDETQEFR